MADLIHAAGHLVRVTAFTTAMTVTACIAKLPLVALAITRRIAPVDMRHLCDRQARDADLIELCDRACALYQEADTVARMAPSGRPFKEIDQFERQHVSPLDDERDALEVQADAIISHTIHGHRARARWLVSTDRIDRTDPAWALVRDLMTERHHG